MRIEIREAPFDPLDEMRQYQDSIASLGGQYGATASFVGSMRDSNEGHTVTAMTLEHYSGMTERHIKRIVENAAQRWRLLDALVLHRIGQLLPNDSIVLVAVWAAHRAEAFEACRHIMESLKSQAPFWKRETRSDEEHWVERNTPGGHA